LSKKRSGKLNNNNNISGKDLKSQIFSFYKPSNDLPLITIDELKKDLTKKNTISTVWKEIPSSINSTPFECSFRNRLNVVLRPNSIYDSNNSKLSEITFTSLHTHSIEKESEDEFE
jgi:hypothetical protein